MALTFISGATSRPLAMSSSISILESLSPVANPHGKVELRDPPRRSRRQSSSPSRKAASALAPALQINRPFGLDGRETQLWLAKMGITLAPAERQAASTVDNPLM